MPVAALAICGDDAPPQADNPSATRVSTTPRRPRGNLLILDLAPSLGKHFNCSLIAPSQTPAAALTENQNDVLINFEPPT